MLFEEAETKKFFFSQFLWFLEVKQMNFALLGSENRDRNNKVDILSVLQHTSFILDCPSSSPIKVSRLGIDVRKV